MVRNEGGSLPDAPLRRGGPDDAAQQLRAAVQQFVRSFGLLSGDQTPCGQPVSPSHAHALMLLLDAGRSGERVSQQVLAASLGLDKSSVTRLCAKMQGLGQIDQEVPEADGRARLVGLTAKGRRSAERIEAASRARFHAVLQAMPSAAVREGVMAALKHLNDAVAVIGEGKNGETSA